MYDFAISLNNLCKSFQHVAAVDGVSLMIEKWEIFGIQEMDAVRSCIGVVFQDGTIDGKLTSRKNQDFHAQLYGLVRDMNCKRIDNTSDMADLRESEAFDDPLSEPQQRRRTL